MVREREKGKEGTEWEKGKEGTLRNKFLVQALPFSYAYIQDCGLQFTVYSSVGLSSTDAERQLKLTEGRRFANLWEWDTAWEGKDGYSSFR